MGGFGEATAVRRTGEGRYAAELDADFGFEAALNGGYLMAVLARAALDASGRLVAQSRQLARAGRPRP